MKHIPIRIIKKDENLQIILEPVSPIDENGIVILSFIFYYCKGTPRSFKSILAEILPDTFGDDCEQDSHSAPRAMVHGTLPSLETPVYWLSENCCHPDNFLYVIVVE